MSLRTIVRRTTLPLRTTVRNTILHLVHTSTVARPVDPEEIVGAAEIADRLGVGTSVVHDWRRRHPEFPQPILRLSMGLAWYWPAVKAWAEATGRPIALPE